MTLAGRGDLSQPRVMADFHPELRRAARLIPRLTFTPGLVRFARFVQRLRGTPRPPAAPGVVIRDVIVAAPADNPSLRVRLYSRRRRALAEVTVAQRAPAV
jgi:hypothetical protein